MRAQPHCCTSALLVQFANDCPLSPAPFACLQGGFLVQLYQNFVAGFAHKINLLKLAFFAVAVGKQMGSPEVRRCGCLPCSCGADGEVQHLCLFTAGRLLRGCQACNVQLHTVLRTHACHLLGFALANRRQPPL